MRQKTAAAGIPSPKEVARDADLFSRALLKIEDKDKNLIPFIHNPIQRDYLQKRTPFDLVVKPRQIGFTTLILGEMQRYVWTRPTSALSLSNTDDNTAKLRLIAERFYNNLPLNFRPARHLANAVMTTYPVMRSEMWIQTAGAKGVGRSSSFTRLHFSEVAYYPDAESVVYGTLQAGRPVWVVAESTANGAQGWFYEEAMLSLDGKSKWTVHFYPWWTDPTYFIPLEAGEALDYSDDELHLIRQHGLTAAQIKWRRDKLREIKHLFPQEYPEDVRACFLTSGMGYFGDIEGCYTAPMGATPQEGHKYIGAIDWGQMQDKSVLSIADKTTRQQVDLLMLNQMPYPDIRHQFIRKLKYWNVDSCSAEINSASGNVDSLRREAYNEGWRGSIIGYQTTNQGKAADMSSLRDALHDGQFELLPIDEQKVQMRVLQVKQTAGNAWKIEAMSGQHDDIPIVLMQLWRLMAFGANFTPPVKR